jgi:death-on-curing protein
LAKPVVSLSVDDLIALHKVALTLGDGGSEGIRSNHQLASAALQPYQSICGEDAYPSIAEKAAAHAFFLAENQPFLDGNKRTAALALTVFLDLNGYELYEANETELADMLISVGSENGIEQGEFFGWVCNHAKPKPEGSC